MADGGQSNVVSYAVYAIDNEDGCHWDQIKQEIGREIEHLEVEKHLNPDI